MAYELREKSANIFSNGFKTKENHPDYNGEFLFNGVPFKVALWTKKDKNGKDFFGMSISEKQANQNTNVTPPATGGFKPPF